jgi:regulator of protease activity HflC (stomatin/prohibitin superfamily)
MSDDKKGWYVTTTDRHGNTDRVLNTPKIMKLAISIAVAIIVLVVIWPFSIVNANERGIRYTFGEAQNTVLEPGVHLHAPIVGKIKTWKIVPNKLAIDIDIGSAGAISKDNQIIGTRLVMYWNYDAARIYDVATKYDDKAIENLLASSANSSIKSVIGRYTIFDLAANQETIGNAAAQLVKTQVTGYPVEITQLNISNFDWSSEFDQQIQATMNAAQQVRQAEQKANIAEQENRRLLIESEAKAKADIAASEGRLEVAKNDAETLREKANGERDAQISKGEGVQKYNSLVAQNLSIEIRLKELEIEKIRAEKWNGKQVPDYVPLNPAGGIVTLPGR